MARVTIEGTVTPSTYLGRGQQRTVTRTDFIDTLVRKGFVKIVQIHEDPKPVKKTRAAKPVREVSDGS